MSQSQPESPQSRLVKFAFEGEIVRFFLPDADDHIQKTIARERTFYEITLLQDMRRRVAGPGVAIDVGANIGNHTVFLSKFCGLRVVALEPFDHCYEILLRNLALNDVEDQVTALWKAAGRRKARGEVRVVNPRNLGQTQVEICKGGSIPIVPLDGLGIRSEVKVIKVDVEGMELEVLQGASRIIRRWHPVLYVESATAEQRDQVRSLLLEWGYCPVVQLNVTPTFVYVPVRTRTEQHGALSDLAESLWREKEERSTQRDRSLQQIEQLRTEIVQRTKEVGRGVERSFEDLVSRGKRVDAQLGALSQRAEKSEAQLSALVGRAEATHSQLCTLTRQSEKLEALSQRAETSEAQLGALVRRAEAIDSQLGTLTRQSEKTDAQLETLARRVETTESYFRGIEQHIEKTGERSLQRMVEAQRAIEQQVAARLGALEARLEGSLVERRALDQELQTARGSAEQERAQRATAEQRALQLENTLHHEEQRHEARAASLEEQLQRERMDRSQLEARLEALKQRVEIDEERRREQISLLGEELREEKEARSRVEMCSEQLGQQLRAEERSRLESTARAEFLRDQLGSERRERFEAARRMEALEERLRSEQQVRGEAGAELTSLRQELATERREGEKRARDDAERRMEQLEHRLRAEQLRREADVQLESLQQRVQEHLLREKREREKADLQGKELQGARQRFEAEERRRVEAAGKAERLEREVAAERQRRAKVDEQLGRLKEDFDAERRRRSELDSYAWRLKADAAYLRAELTLRDEEVRYQLGDALVRAARPSLDTLKLPYRFAHLLLVGRKRVRARRRGLRSEPDVSPEWIPPFERGDTLLSLGRAKREAPPASPPSPGGAKLPAEHERTPEPAPGASQVPNAPAGNPGPGGLISVIMTTFNSRSYVSASIESILRQTHTNLELIIVDDASTDGTFDRLMEHAHKDPRVQPFKALTNRGTYWCKNFGITRSLGEYVTFQDSDDVSEPRRLELQLRELRQSEGAVASTCNYVRRDKHGKVVLNRGLRERRALISLMFKKRDVIDRVGYFDTVRTSADDEYLERLRLVFGDPAIRHVNQALYTAQLRPDSLTTGGVAPMDLGSLKTPAVRQEFLSPVRAEYHQTFKNWHALVKTDREDPFVAFPLRSRRFPAPAALLPGRDAGTDRVIVSVASIPSRIEGLREVVDRLLPQVDELNVYLNHYDGVPSFLDRPKVRVARSQDHGDLRDNGKFFFLRNLSSGYYLTVDDDIEYPADYVQTLLLKIDQYGHRAIAGVHGVWLADPLLRFYRDRTVVHFREANVKDRFVNLLGTGTVAFHSSTLHLTTRDFRNPGMADLWLAIAAKRQGVPMIAIARRERWLSALPVADGSLYTEFANAEGDEVQTLAAQKEGPWDRSAVQELCRPLATDLLRQFTVVELSSREVDVEFLQEAHPGGARVPFRPGGS